MGDFKYYSAEPESFLNVSSRDSKCLPSSVCFKPSSNPLICEAPLDVYKKFKIKVQNKILLKLPLLEQF